MKIAVVELEGETQRATIVVAAQSSQLLNELVRNYAEQHGMAVVDVVDSTVGVGSIVYQAITVTGDGEGRDNQFS